MKQYQITFGKNMLLKARANGISQVDISCKIEVTSGLISDYKNGNKTISLEKAVQIADMLNCSIDELLERYEYISKNEDIVNSLMEEKYIECQKENIELKRKNAKLVNLISSILEGNCDLKKTERKIAKLSCEEE